MSQRYSLKSIPSFWCSHGEQCFAQVDLIIAFDGLWLKLKLRKYPAIDPLHTNYIISHSTTLQNNHNIWHGTKAEKKYWTQKIMISTGLPYFQFSMNSQGFSPARLTWPAYDDGRKRENSSARKHRIIVASTCRRSVEFGRYVTWLWVANCVSVMTKMLHFICITSLSLAMAGQPEKRHNMRAQQQDSVSDWLNQTRPFSLGTMSASAYIENAA